MLLPTIEASLRAPKPNRWSYGSRGPLMSPSRRRARGGHRTAVGMLLSRWGGTGEGGWTAPQPPGFRPWRGGRLRPRGRASHVTGHVLSVIAMGDDASAFPNLDWVAISHLDIFAASSSSCDPQELGVFSPGGDEYESCRSPSSGGFQPGREDSTLPGS